VLCAAIWLFADLKAGAVYSSSLIPFWNALMRLGYFSLHCYLIGLLTDMIKAMKDLSFHDPLTKAANWRCFEEYSEKSIKSAIREKRAVTLAFIDLDNFKALNDRLGHGTGDEALVLVARTISARIRPEDMLARLGGDEFLLQSGPDFPGADEALKRLHAAITFASLSQPIGTMIAQADDLMYEVKKAGKNAMRHIEQP
jgi:diguanylate cyclase (GGDEF)-like protein